MKENKPKLDMSKLGFKTAFKATLGFYLAQFVATVLGILLLVSGCAVVATVVYFVGKK